MSLQMEYGQGTAHEYGTPMQRHWSPYASNGGTGLALSGTDFAIVASDTRLSEGFSIHSRDAPKTYQLTDTTVLSCAGFHGDILALTKYIEARLQASWKTAKIVMESHIYEHEHNKKMSTSAIAAMLSTILYYKRFFPYYVYNIIGGIDDEGKGCIYSFDPVGSYERESYRAGGSAGTILQPLLDNQIGFKNQTGVVQTPLSMERAVQLVKDVFISAAERDIYTGDSLVIRIITKDGIKTETFPLRKD